MVITFLIKLIIYVVHVYPLCINNYNLISISFISVSEKINYFEGTPLKIYLDLNNTLPYNIYNIYVTLLWLCAFMPLILYTRDSVNIIFSKTLKFGQHIKLIE